MFYTLPQTSAGHLEKTSRRRPDACNCTGRLVPTKGHGSPAYAPSAGRHFSSRHPVNFAPRIPAGVSRNSRRTTSAVYRRPSGKDGRHSGPVEAPQARRKRTSPRSGPGQTQLVAGFTRALFSFSGSQLASRRPGSTARRSPVHCAEFSDASAHFQSVFAAGRLRTRCQRRPEERGNLRLSEA